MINIFNLKPNVVSRDLSGKSFLFYGERKSGKTTNASKFPKPIILAFEKGYGLISNVVAQPLNTWSEALEAKMQLLDEAEEVKEHNRIVEETGEGEKRETTFKTVVVDTADIAYDLCEKYILIKEGVEYLDETESKRGYRALSREYDKFFQEIVKAGYTLVIISHATSKQVKEGGEKYDKTIPTVPDRGFQIISRLVDVCGYASLETDEETGETVPMLTLRGTKFLEAGSRNKYMSTRIPFTYEALREDMAKAVDKMAKVDGGVVDEAVNLFTEQSEEIDFEDTVKEIKKIAMKLNSLKLMSVYTKIVTEYLGKGRNVMDCDESQIEILRLILIDLRKYITKENISLD